MKYFKLIIILFLLNITQSTFGQLTYEGDIDFQSQSEIDEFGAMNYEVVDGTVFILQNDFLEDDIVSLAPLSSLVQITGSLNILNTIFLESLEGLNNLEVIGSGVWNQSPNGGVFSLNNTGVRRLCALESLQIITETLVIKENGSLNYLDGLESVTKIYEGVTIEYNEFLLDLDGLENVDECYGGYRIRFNDFLHDYCGSTQWFGNTPPNFFTYWVTGNFYNPSLDDMNDMNCIEYGSWMHDGDVTLTSQAEVDAFGENNYWEITGDLFISGVDINDLEPLWPLDVVEGDVTITDNPILADLYTLNTVEKIQGSLTITNNDVLTDYCALRTMFNKDRVEGEVTIANNFYNPTNEQVGSFFECELEIVGIDPISQADFRIYPNPAISVLKIQSTENVKMERYEVLDISGRIVLTGVENSIDVRNLEAGSYVLRIYGGNLYTSLQWIKE